jgi:hypothetical protein
VVRNEVGCGGDEEGDDVELVASLNAELLRLRKLKLGNR